ncbi:MAG: ABC transporter substrate-binding protein [Clostridiales bacterium]|jgi:hypothetical protein|nr:ABC transporter substrate-binding protein [Clostridiales bacterium]
MKETIYTIPVNEAFEKPCECPMCNLENRFENDRVNYYLGPSLMEPENRIETNEKGFCAKHFKMMYETRTNRLGLGLMLHTHLCEQNQKLEKLARSAAAQTTDTPKKSFFASLKSGGENAKAAENLLKYIEDLEAECCICQDLVKTMERYCEVITHLYFTEKDFRDHFNGGLGFCMPHFAMLIRAAKKNLSGAKQEEFLGNLVRMQLSNLKRIEGEVEWFTKKFDYRNQDADWGNSRDAVSRSIEKLTGLTGLGQ